MASSLYELGSPKKGNGYEDSALVLGILRRLETVVPGCAKWPLWTTAQTGSCGGLAESGSSLRPEDHSALL
jgi:hypothetical protein